MWSQQQACKSVDKCKIEQFCTKVYNINTCDISNIYDHENRIEIKTIYLRKSINSATIKQAKLIRVIDLMRNTYNWQCKIYNKNNRFSILDQYYAEDVFIELDENKLLLLLNNIDQALSLFGKNVLNTHPLYSLRPHAVSRRLSKNNRKKRDERQMQNAERLINNNGLFKDYWQYSSKLPNYYIYIGKYKNSVSSKRYDCTLKEFNKKHNAEQTKKYFILLFTSIIEALMVLNEIKIAHCDINPSNIMVYIGQDKIEFHLDNLRTAHPLLTKIVHPSQDNSLHIQTYTAPETYSKINGKESYISQRYDMWSIALTMLYIIGDDQLPKDVMSIQKQLLVQNPDYQNLQNNLYTLVDRYTQRLEYIDNIYPMADILKSMLNIDQTLRPTDIYELYASVIMTHIYNPYSYDYYNYSNSTNLEHNKVIKCSNALLNLTNLIQISDIIHSKSCASFAKKIAREISYIQILFTVTSSLELHRSLNNEELTILLVLAYLHKYIDAQHELKSTIIRIILNNYEASDDNIFNILLVLKSKLTIRDYDALLKTAIADTRNDNLYLSTLIVYFQASNQTSVENTIQSIIEKQKTPVIATLKKMQDYCQKLNNDIITRQVIQSIQKLINKYTEQNLPQIKIHNMR